MSKKATKEDFIALYNELVDAYFVANSIFHKYGYENKKELRKALESIYALKDVIHRTYITEKKVVSKAGGDYACLLF